MLFQLRQFFAVFLVSTLLFLSSCATQAPSRFEQAQQESTQRGASAVVRESESGGSFNRFFPPSSAGYERVYTQEKKGFAEAKLKKDGKEMAVMAISDTLNNPSAVTKFEKSSQKIGGYPAISQGSTATAVLVAGRFQVKVLSRDPAFSESDRQAWLEMFDFNGLARLK
ncbi:hypothetical protein VB715_15860 [Crocosphaera sp. UHCC 0190]|uniref:hypothetical protein n=1 Tax=Crocosphaera sp. UHCC 0190 TaxID=3110246 RepID=UPI002B1FD5FD|nr:hypothetical protein [Crocosphaera sp. UHCC 0190]MEA5511249.1 hypothetical protein [Crocosphaera sp. UHCC 0190]